MKVILLIGCTSLAIMDEDNDEGQLLIILLKDFFNIF